MSFNDLMPYPAPQKVTIKDVQGDTRIPYERIKAYDDKEFELFIREWVTSLSERYQIRGFGGAGDKGRDVVAKDLQGKYYYFQCKHYDHPLTPSDMLPEFGKLVYYTFTEEIPLPNEYYILAPWDIGGKLSDLIDGPKKINASLLSEWDKKCQNRIISTPIPMTHKLQSYIETFDFSIIKTKSMLEVIEEHRTTAFYAFRFGGGLTIKRDRKISVPAIAEKYEVIYIQKILQAISEKEGQVITSLDELYKQFPIYTRAIQVHRERFYSAENLKLFASKYLLSDEYFKELSDDIYYGIFDYLEMAYNNGYERLNSVMAQVAKIDLKHSLLVKYDLIHPQDRQGICHQIANERDDFVWTNTT